MRGPARARGADGGARVVPVRTGLPRADPSVPLSHGNVRSLWKHRVEMRGHHEPRLALRALAGRHHVALAINGGVAEVQLTHPAEEVLGPDRLLEGRGRDLGDPLLLLEGAGIVRPDLLQQPADPRIGPHRLEGGGDGGGTLSPRTVARRQCRGGAGAQDQPAWHPWIPHLSLSQHKVARGGPQGRSDGVGMAHAGASDAPNMPSRRGGDNLRQLARMPQEFQVPPPPVAPPRAFAGQANRAPPSIPGTDRGNLGGDNRAGRPCAGKPAESGSDRVPDGRLATPPVVSTASLFVIAR
jgi:hypothetical protein